MRSLLRPLALGGPGFTSRECTRAHAEAAVSRRSHGARAGRRLVTRHATVIVL
jgi:hypothetical protein